MAAKHLIHYVGDGKGHANAIFRASPDATMGRKYRFVRGEVTEVPKALHALLVTEKGFRDGAKETKAEPDGPVKAGKGASDG